MFIALIITLILLLICSAVISGTETAIFKLDRETEDEFEEKSSEEPKYRRVVMLKSDTDRFLSVILISNNLVNIAATLVANRILVAILEETNISPAWNFILNVVILTFILLFCGEILPKLMANSNPKRFVLFSVDFIYILSIILKPISWFLQKIGGTIAKHVPVQDVNVNRSQLQQAIQITETDSQQDKRILSGIASFSILEAVEICIPRVDVFAIAADMPFDQVLSSAMEKGFSRIPVFGEDIDHIIGVLYVKDLIPYIDASNDFDWKKLIRTPYYVPEHKKIDDILSEFRRRKIHFAVVVDEYGGSLGIITMEDILEEIIGDISDESDKPETFYQKISKDTWIFDGKTHIVDFLRILQLDQDYLDAYKGESDTLAGVLLEVKGEFFAQDDSLKIEKITFTAQEVDKFKIKKVKVQLEDGLL